MSSSDNWIKVSLNLIRRKSYGSLKSIKRKPVGYFCFYFVFQCKHEDPNTDCVISDKKLGKSPKMYDRLE